MRRNADFGYRSSQRGRAAMRDGDRYYRLSLKFAAEDWTTRLVLRQHAMGARTL